VRKSDWIDKNQRWVPPTFTRSESSETNEIFVLLKKFPLLKERVFQTDIVYASVGLSKRSESSISELARDGRFSLKN
jgi:hypothetical protein